MGKKKGRHAAKTGDRALYRQRQNNSEAPTTTGIQRGVAPNIEDDENDTMYNQVERFHNRRDEQEFLKFDAGEQGNNSDDDDDDDMDDGITGREAVMDLAAGGETSSSDDDEEDEEENDTIPGKEDDDDDDEEEEVEMSSDNDEDDEEENDNMGNTAFDWGKRKAAYYQGDTADLEIGQDVDDAFLEEEAAKEVQAARFKEMSEDDFVLSDTEPEPHDENDASSSLQNRTTTTTTTKRDWSKLSKKDQRKFLQTRHPELLPLTAYFGDVMKDWNDRTRVATKALLESDEATAEAVGATALGKEYLLTKTMLQASMALNVTMYLLLKAEQASSSSSPHDVDDASAWIQAHPVMARLQQLNSLALKLEEQVESKVDTLPEQLDNLAKAAALMQSGQEEDDDDEDDDEEEEDHEHVNDDDSKDIGLKTDALQVEAKSKFSKTNGGDQRLTLFDAGGDEESDAYDDDDDDQNEIATSVLNEARFGLRTKDLATDASKKRLHKKNKNHMAKTIETDIGDDENGEPGNYKDATKTLSATINSIKQRAETQSRKRQRAPIEDEVEDHDDQLRRGLEMMEADLGQYSGDEGGDALDHGDNGDDLDEDEDGFYGQIKKKSKAKKDFKKELYHVAPKYPRLEEEVEGERAVNKFILKNRGLVAHKAKINRNPRVKKREQYRKAIIRRKGSVRDVRPNEGHKYGGESTGVKTNLSRSRKLGAT